MSWKFSPTSTRHHTCFAILCWRLYGSMDSFWRCKSRSRTASAACRAPQLSIAQSVERSCKEAFPSLIQFLTSRVPWIPESDVRNMFYNLIDCVTTTTTHYIVEVTAVSVVLLWIKVVIVVMTRAGGTWISSGHCAGRRRERTLDVLHSSLLLRNGNLERTIDGVGVLDGGRLATGSIVLAVALVHQILKLYSNICTWET